MLFLSPFLLSTKRQGHKSKLAKSKTFGFVEAPKGTVWSLLTMGCFNYILEFFFGGVSPLGVCYFLSHFRGF